MRELLKSYMKPNRSLFKDKVPFYQTPLGWGDFRNFKWNFI